MELTLFELIKMAQREAPAPPPEENQGGGDVEFPGPVQPEEAQARAETTEEPAPEPGVDENLSDVDYAAPVNPEREVTAPRDYMGFPTRRDWLRAMGMYFGFLRRLASFARRHGYPMIPFVPSVNRPYVGWFLPQTAYSGRYQTPFGYAGQFTGSRQFTPVESVMIPSLFGGPIPR